MLSPLRGMPDCRDRHVPATETIRNNIGRTADYQLTNSRFGSDPAKIGILPQSLNNGDDTRGQSFRSFRFVPGYISPNLLQS